MRTTRSLDEETFSADQLRAVDAHQSAVAALREASELGVSVDATVLAGIIAAARESFNGLYGAGVAAVYTSSGNIVYETGV
jgi:hypothetical protein